MNNDPEKAALADILSFVTELIAKAQINKGMEGNEGLADVAQSGQLGEGTSADLMQQAGQSPEEAFSPVADNAAAGLEGNAELAETAKSGKMKPGSYKEAMDQLIDESPKKDDEEEEY